MSRVKRPGGLQEGKTSKAEGSGWPKGGQRNRHAGEGAKRALIQPPGPRLVGITVVPSMVAHQGGPGPRQESEPAYALLPSP